MRKIAIVLTLVLVVSLVACGNSSMSQEDKIKVLMKNEDYDAAIEELTKMIESDRRDIAAWDLKAECLIKSEQYDQADQFLGEYLNLIDDNLDKTDFDLVDAVDSVGDFGRDMLRNGVEPGDWYYTLKPEAVNMDELAWSYNVGDVMKIEVPKGGTLLYTVDDSDPRSKGMVYKNGITLEEEGYFTLKVIVTNRYQEYSPIATAYIDVYSDGQMDDTSGEDTLDTNDNTGTTNDNTGDATGDGDGNETDDSVYVGDLIMPELDMVSGSYEGPISVSVSNYLPELSNIDIYYTLDGSDPTSYDNDYHYYYDSIELGAGDTTISLSAYNYDTDEYSPVASYDFNVYYENSIKLGFYNIPDLAMEQYRNTFIAAANNGVYVEPVIITDLDNLDITNLPDAVITYGAYAEDLSQTGVVVDVNKFFDLKAYDYVADAEQIGTFGQTTYMLPLTIRPEYMLYGDYDSTGISDWDYLKGESDYYSAKFMYPIDDPAAFLGFYYGLGGQPIDPESDHLSLDRGKVLEALNVILAMKEDGLLDNYVYSQDMYDEIYNYGAENFLAGDWMEFDSNRYYSYYQVDGMPMPNGADARYYNVSTGIYVSAIGAATNPALIGEIQDLYDYLIYDAYDLLTISEYMGSIPAMRDLANEAEYYTNIPYQDYIKMVEYGISDIQTYKLYDLYEVIGQALMDLADGQSVDTVADAIMAGTY